MSAPAPNPAKALGPSQVAVRVYAWGGGLLAGLGVVQLLADEPVPSTWVAVLCALAIGAGVGLLPRRTVPALLVLLSAVAVMVVSIGVPVFASFVALMVAAFTLTRYGSGRTVAVGVLVLAVAVTAVAVPEIASGQDGVFGLVYPIFWFGGAAVLGWLARQRAEHEWAVVSYAETLEREQQQRAELAAAAERERLARDVHDIVSHGVSLMVVQAEAAREVLHTQPEAAARALDAIADAGRSAISDLHRLLDVLRRPGTDLHALAASLRRAGLTVDLDVSPGWEQLEETPRAALYRVAQESVTNTLRHAEGVGRVAIRVVTHQDLAHMEVLDDGKGHTGYTHGNGSGIAGLTARLATLGGSLEAGPRPDATGFAVRAEVPVRTR